MKPGLYLMTGIYFQGSKMNSFYAQFTVLLPGDVPIFINWMNDNYGGSVMEMSDISEDGFTFSKNEVRFGGLYFVWKIKKVVGTEGYYVGEYETSDGRTGAVNAFIKEHSEAFFHPDFARIAEKMPCS